MKSIDHTAIVIVFFPNICDTSYDERERVKERRGWWARWIHVVYFSQQIEETVTLESLSASSRVTHEMLLLLLFTCYFYPSGGLPKRTLFFLVVCIAYKERKGRQENLIKCVLYNQGSATSFCIYCSIEMKHFSCFPYVRQFYFNQGKWLSLKRRKRSSSDLLDFLEKE